MAGFDGNSGYFVQHACAAIQRFLRSDRISDDHKRAAVGQYTLLTQKMPKTFTDVALESPNPGIDFRLLLYTVPFGGEKNEMALTGRINLWYI